MKTQIFIIDDDPVVRHLLGSILRAAGHEVEVAETGTAAMARLKERAASGTLPRLIFLDLHLPDSTGAQLLRQIRALVADHNGAAGASAAGSAADGGSGGAQVAVAILTANSEAETKKLFPELSADVRPDFFLEKPFPPQKANEIVLQLLAGGPPG